MAKVYPCKTCGGSFELSEFPRRQQDHVQASRPGWCKSCSPAARSPNSERASKERQVASFVHTESGGNVDGKKRTLRGCPRRAAIHEHGTHATSAVLRLACRIAALRTAHPPIRATPALRLIPAHSGMRAVSEGNLRGARTEA